MMLLAMPFVMHNKNAKVKKGKLSSSACLMIIGSCYTDGRRGAKKARYYTGIATVKGKEWRIRQGI